MAAPIKEQYKNQFQETPLRSPAEVKVEIKRRKARAKAIREQNGRSNGFTLIEVMIVICIIAILSVVALPAYQDHKAKQRAQGPSQEQQSSQPAPQKGMQAR